MSGFGIHSHSGMDRGRQAMAPAYVLIEVSSVTDADAFKKALQDLITATAPFSGRLAVDSEKPVSWGGTASEHIVIIQFSSAEQAQSWKESDAFKGFDAALHRSSDSTMQLMRGIPIPLASGGRGGARFDAKTFEPNVKDYDRLLHQQLKNICKGCYAHVVDIINGAQVNIDKGFRRTARHVN